MRIAVCGKDGCPVVVEQRALVLGRLGSFDARKVCSDESRPVPLQVLTPSAFFHDFCSQVEEDRQTHDFFNLYKLVTGRRFSSALAVDKTLLSSSTYILRMMFASETVQRLCIDHYTWISCRSSLAIFPSVSFSVIQKEGWREIHIHDLARCGKCFHS